MFKIEPHSHTDESSNCGKIPGAELAERYHEIGYDGIAITDHLYEGMLKKLDDPNDWDACVDFFLRGYKAAKARGDEIGISVILGAEIRFKGCPNDYLVYGIDEKFLRDNPFLFRTDPWSFYKKFGGELVIIHAHPFRGGNEAVYTDCIHGIEAVNLNPRHPSRNELAIALSEAHPELLVFYGSDTHQIQDIGCAWMLFNKEIHNSEEFRRAVLARDYALGKVDQP